MRRQGVSQTPLTTNADGVKLQVKETRRRCHQAITYGPGASSGWHSHLGVVVIVVKDGSVTRYLSDCVGQTYHAGGRLRRDSDLGPMVLRNESTTTPAHVSATFVVPQPVPATLLIDRPNSGCAPLENAKGGCPLDRRAAHIPEESAEKRV
jgi:hypothetical protein